MARTGSSKSTKPAALDPTMRIVVLHGKEPMIQRLKLDELRSALEAEHGQIEQHDIDGQTAELAEVLDELRSFSLMQTYKLVLVEKAEEFVKRHRDALSRYAQNPVDHATLVLRSETWNKGNLDKAINKVGALVKCDPPKPGEAVAWLTKRSTKAHGKPITREGAQALVNRLGTSLGQLDTELAKLALMVGEGKSIDESVVEQAVGRSSEQQAFAVQEAVLHSLQRRDSREAIEQVRELLDLASQPEVLVMYFVDDLMRKLAVAGAMRGQGISDNDIAEAIKIWGSRRRPFFDCLDRLGPTRCLHLLDQALTADRRSKSGFGQTRRNLEGFCAIMTDNSSMTP